MDRSRLELLIEETWNSCTGNYLQGEKLLHPKAEGVAMFEKPIFGVADAEDDVFSTFQQPDVVGEWHRTPKQWLLRAKSDVSGFSFFGGSM